MPQLPAIGEEVPQLAASANGPRPPELPPIGGEVVERPPDFRATNEPPSTALKAAAFGKDALQLALDALPGAGAVIGGTLATPETMGGGTLVGAALGAGAGRGLRDLISAGLGLQKPSTAIAEGGKIAMDAGETYVAGLVLPALWSAIKAPGATVADVFDGMRKLYAASPKAVKAFMPDFEALAKLPKGVGKAPAAILERPAWQTWQDHLPDAQPSPQVARSTSTSMIPAAVQRPVSMGPPPTAPVAAAVPAATEFEAAQAARQAAADSAVVRMGADGTLVGRPAGNPALPDQKAVNDAALAARRAAYQASRPAAPAAAEPIVAASGKMRLTGPEMVEFNRLRKTGLSQSQAYEKLKEIRDIAARFGSPTPEQMAADMAYRRSRSKS